MVGWREHLGTDLSGLSGPVLHEERRDIMGRSRTLTVLLVASCVLAGCAPTKFLDISATDKLPQRLELRGFSIAPPAGPNWYWIAGFTGVVSVTAPKADLSKQSRVLFAHGDQNWGATPSNFPPPDKEGYRTFAFATAIDVAERRFGNAEEFRRFTEERA
ncbi:MAG: hypothetical protein ACRDHY_07830, partial [Anaerolineales bacterium]